MTGHNSSVETSKSDEYQEALGWMHQVASCKSVWSDEKHLEILERVRSQVKRNSATKAAKLPPQFPKERAEKMGPGPQTGL